MAFPSNPTANQTFTTPSGSTYIFKNGSWNAQSGGSSGGTGTVVAASTSITVVPVTTIITLSDTNSANILELSDGAQVTVPAGLSAGFNVTMFLPATGSITLFPAPGVVLNGSSSQIVKSYGDSTISIIPTSSLNTYKVTGV